MKTCKLCGKGSRMVGNRKLLRGHYNPTNWTRKYPNLQKATTPKGEKVVCCTKCIRGFSKTDRIVNNRIKRVETLRLRIEKSKLASELNRAKQLKANEARKTKKGSSESKEGTEKKITKLNKKVAKKTTKKKSLKKNKKKKATK